MNEFSVELFLDSDDKENIKLSSLDKKDMEQWRKDMEVRALSEYHNRKIEILSKKI